MFGTHQNNFPEIRKRFSKKWGLVVSKMLILPKFNFMFCNIYWCHVSNIPFMFSGRYWCHIQDFQDFIKRIFGIVRSLCFQTCPKDRKPIMSRYENNMFENNVPIIFLYVLKYFYITKNQKVDILSIWIELWKVPKMSKKYWNPSGSLH